MYCLEKVFFFKKKTVYDAVYCLDGGFLAGATQETNGLNSSSADRRYGGEGHTVHPMKISIIQQYFLDHPQEHRLKCCSKAMFFDLSHQRQGAKGRHDFNQCCTFFRYRRNYV